MREGWVMIGKLGTYIGDFFLCMLLAPAGILKIANRQMKRKQELVRGGQKLLVMAGVCLIVFFILITDSTMWTNPFTYLYGSGGILALVLGAVTMKKGMTYQKYVAAVENHGLLTVFDIGQLLKQPQETVTRALLAMITDGFFPELKFDAQAKCLQPMNPVVRNVRSRAVDCTSCGARVTVFEGQPNKCEYCGDALDY